MSSRDPLAAGANLVCLLMRRIRIEAAYALKSNQDVPASICDLPYGFDAGPKDIFAGSFCLVVVAGVADSSLCKGISVPAG